MNTGKVLLGVFAGVAAGALLGVLLAPDKGSVTRNKLAKLGEDYSEDLLESINDLKESLMSKLDSVTGGTASMAANTKAGTAVKGAAHAGNSDHKYSQNS